MFCVFADYFKETDSDGKDAVHSAIQRLQRDPDRDVRYFAGVEEDALDLTYDVHTSSLHTAREYLQDMRCSPVEEFELEDEPLEDEGSRVEGVNEIHDDNVENRTETLDCNEHLEDFDQAIVLQDLSSTEAFVDTNLETTTQEFEENERRLDLESEDDDTDLVETAADESDEAAGSTEETVQQSNEVLYW